MYYDFNLKTFLNKHLKHYTTTNLRHGVGREGVKEVMLEAEKIVPILGNEVS